MSVLVTGGAGYIGGHVVDALLNAGRQVVVVDDLSTGRPDRIRGLPLVQVDVASPVAVDVLAGTITRWGVASVVHLAARKRVDESMARPDWYHQQNVGGTENVLAAMTRTGVGRLVFSSSAAVYGSPAGSLVDEDAPLAPVNTYGRTKVAGERALAAAASAGIRSVALRYFNVAGAASPLLRDDEEANLVTIVLGRLARGEAPQVYGTDYPTPDGTCVRDLVDVRDVAAAHLAALRVLEEAQGPATTEALNVGTEVGVSVRQVVDRLRALDACDLPVEELPRRDGDPAAVVAAAGRARARLGWSAVHDADDVLRSAWSAARPGR